MLISPNLQYTNKETLFYFSHDSINLFHPLFHESSPQELYDTVTTIVG
jgi:hypothetical protein